MASVTKVVIRTSAGKGQGLFATRDIAVGENILCEAPIDTVDDRALQYFAGYDRRLGPAARLIKVMQRSGLPTDDGTHALFTVASKINHSCCPNANYHWSTKSAINIQALVDIEQGEEVTVSYLDTKCWDVRQEILIRSFDFVCTCLACRVDDKCRDVAVRLALHLKDKIVSTLMHDREISEHTLTKSFELICSHQELRGELPSALYDAFQFACANRDRGAAIHYMNLKLKYGALFHGEHNDSIPTFEALNGDPANHRAWGMAVYPSSSVKRVDVEAMLGF